MQYLSLSTRSNTEFDAIWLYYDMLCQKNDQHYTTFCINIGVVIFGHILAVEFSA